MTVWAKLDLFLKSSQCSAEEERGETGLRRCGLRREQLGLEPPLPHHHHHHYHQQDHHHHLLLSLPNTSTVSWRRPSTTLPHLLPISVIWSDLLSTSYWFLTYQLHCKQQSFLSRGKTPHLTFHCFFYIMIIIQRTLLKPYSQGWSIFCQDIPINFVF